MFFDSEIVNTKFSVGDLRTIIVCLRGYRIPGAESLANQIEDSLKKKGLIY